LEGWAARTGWEALLNKAGTTFRKLPDSAKESIGQAQAIELMIAQPSMIKRPVLEVGKMVVVGFSPDKYADFFRG